MLSLSLKQRRIRDAGLVAAASLVAGFAIWYVTNRSGAAEPQAADVVKSPVAEKADPAAVEFFEKQIRPLLVSRCYECHSAQSVKLKGGLRLDSRQAILKGGDTGPAAVPFNSKKSLLVDSINYGDVYQMPPKSKLSAEEIALFTRWVDMGLPFPESSGEKGPAAAKTINVAERKAAHWAWQGVVHREPPAVKDASWPLAPLDQFVLAGLEAKGLAPSPPAGPAVLLRRVYFDLIGLPPSPEDVAAYEKDPSPAALAAIVDRLLQSPQYGERWARHWLDSVRYAESRGHEFDYPIANAWQYRDYVIRAITADVPYNRFVIEHLAGDLLETPRVHPQTGANESVLGTGFWFLGEWVHSPVDIRKDETDRHDNMLDVMGKTFLGLTIGCARCHDHKFDALTQNDYYALAGFLQSSGYRQVPFESLAHHQKLAAELWRTRAKAQSLAGKIAAESLESALGKLPDYLAATRELLAATEQPIPERIAELAKKRGLSAALLSRWVTHLRAAAKDENDLLHPFALAAGMNGAGEEKGREAAQAALAGLAQKRATESAARGKYAVIVNYSQAASDDFTQDGFLFGPGPLRPGDLLLGDASGPPLRGVNILGLVASDSSWAALKDAPGTEHDGSALGKLPRSGRSFRTNSAVLGDGRVHYLVRGGGWAYAAVDSHQMIAGPLHGGLVRGLDGAEDKWRWVTHDLTPYRGHRVHFEFTPKEGQFLEMAQAVEGETPPVPSAGPDERILAAQQTVLAKAAAEWPGVLASLLKEANDSLKTNRFGTGAEASSRAFVADWLVRHRELFVEEGGQATGDAVVDSAELKKLLGRARELTSQIQPTSRTAPAMWEGTAVDENVLLRGNPRLTGPLAQRRLCEALAGNAPMPISRGSGRLELALQIVSPGNPLTARVQVNRIWHHLMGRGLVMSLDNFGVLGDRPTHPELLDHLAEQFVKDGWSTRRMIRTIVLSRTYQMSSHPSEKAREVDPANLLCSHANIRRLEGEAIRDAILAVSGRLDPKQFGPSVPIHLTAFLEGRGRPGDGPLDGNGRRSIYLAVRRNFLSPFMLAFDAPIPFNTNARRNTSNVPAQALILMNDPFVLAEARRWADRALARCGGSPDELVRDLYRTAVARAPSDDELAAAKEFLSEQAARYQGPGEAGKPEAGKTQAESRAKALLHPSAVADLAHVLFNTKEFIYLE